MKIFQKVKTIGRACFEWIHRNDKAEWRIPNPLCTKCGEEMNDAAHTIFRLREELAVYRAESEKEAIQFVLCLVIGLWIFMAANFVFFEAWNGTPVYSQYVNVCRSLRHPAAWILKEIKKP